MFAFQFIYEKEHKHNEYKQTKKSVTIDLRKWQREMSEKRQKEKNLYTHSFIHSCSYTYKISVYTTRTHTLAYGVVVITYTRSIYMCLCTCKSVNTIRIIVLRTACFLFISVTPSIAKPILCLVLRFKQTQRSIFLLYAFELL